MPLTSNQITQYGAAIAAHIRGSGDMVGKTEDEQSALLNTLAVPAFTVWKTQAPIGEVGRTFVAAELAGLSSLNTQRLQNLAAWLSAGVNPSLASVRAFFDDIFSGAGGVNTRVALLALWKRPATRLEKLLATGTGSDAVPATLTVEGTISAQNVSDILARL